MEEKKWLDLPGLYQMFGDTASLKEIFYDWMGLNKWLFVQINSLHHDLYDAVMLLITRLGDSHMFPYYMALLALFVILTTITRIFCKKGGIKHYMSGWAGVFIVLSVSFAIDVGMLRTIKDYYNFPRPYIALAQDQLYANEQVTVLDRKADPDDDYRSFPSGHAVFSTMLVVGMWPMLTPGFQWVGVAFVALVCWSRMALGMHFPADIVGGITFAFLLVLVMRAALYNLLRKLFRLNC